MWALVVEQQAVGTVVWTAYSPSLKDFGQANVDVPLTNDCLSFLEKDGGHMTRSGEEDYDHLEALLDLFKFTGGLSSGTSQTEDCCLISGSYLYTKVLLSVTMSQTCSDLPPSNFQACEGTTPPYSSSVPQSAGMAPNGLNASIHQCGDKGSDSSFMMKDSKCSYFTVIHGSSLIRHFAQSGKAIILTKHFAIWKILAITNYEDAVLM